MANYVRRIVSGYKARFRDDNGGFDLDLIYLTDQIIIMGYPAEGIEGYYRNRRDDVKKFLDSRHKDNYWVFNLCPLTENSYPPTFFEGRVSRYPFPDHHAPPLATLALAAREMREWLTGAEDRVAVIHCKAGKGRSGSIACSYLLAQESSPTAPQLERSHTTKQWAQARADELLEAIELEEEELEASKGKEQQPEGSGLPKVDEDKALSVEPKATATEDSATTQEPQAKHAGPALEEVLALHTSRRMRRPSSPGAKQKHGVSIPSQRRFLSYWAMFLAHAAPSPFWSDPVTPHPKVRLREMRVRIREPSGAKMAAMKLVNTLLETAGVQQGRKKAGRDVQTDELWVSLARYNDEFVDTLEEWERHTRDPSGRMGLRKPGAEHMQRGTEGEETLSELFAGGRWDKTKMVKIFSHLSTTDVQVAPSGPEDKTRQLTYVLHPTPSSMWVHIRKKIKESGKGNIPTERSEQDVSLPGSVSATPTASRNPSMENIVEGEGLLLDACREVRAKLYLGQVFLGWFWFIPIFHMTPGSTSTTHFVLERKEIDFSIGAGAWIIDVDVALQWEDEHSANPAPKTTDVSTENMNALEDAQDEGVKVHDTA